MKIIKRYKNRRLYDTETREFIVIPNLELMVRQNKSFVVIDNSTGKDITLSVLTAVIGEQVHNWRDADLSLDLLQTVIKIGGRRSMNILRNTALAGIGLVNITKKKAEELIETLVKSGELSKSDKKEAVMELLAKAEKTAKDTREKLSRGLDKGIESFPLVMKSDFDKLIKKVDRLSRKLNKIEKTISS
ncbi:MAG: polyhydroxyalkanoate synthesis regulator DNA-binding domain-containing protein [candidate division Zixibacteria bacterium]